MLLKKGKVMIKWKQVWSNQLTGHRCAGQVKQTQGAKATDIGGKLHPKAVYNTNKPNKRTDEQKLKPV